MEVILIAFKYHVDYFDFDVSKNGQEKKNRKKTL